MAHVKGRRTQWFFSSPLQARGVGFALGRWRCLCRPRVAVSPQSVQHDGALIIWFWFLPVWRSSVRRHHLCFRYLVGGRFSSPWALIKKGFYLLDCPQWQRSLVQMYAFCPPLIGGTIIGKVLAWKSENPVTERGQVRGLWEVHKPCDAHLWTTPPTPYPRCQTCSDVPRSTWNRILTMSVSIHKLPFTVQ